MNNYCLCNTVICVEGFRAYRHLTSSFVTAYMCICTAYKSTFYCFYKSMSTWTDTLEKSKKYKIRGSADNCMYLLLYLLTN